MIMTYRDRKRNIYLYNKSFHDNTFMYSWKSFIDIIRIEVGYIDRFNFNLNSKFKLNNKQEIQTFIAPVLLPAEKTGETLTEYLTTQKKYDHGRL